MSRGITFALGPLTVRIAGEHLVTRWAESIFSPLQCQRDPDLCFGFVDQLHPMDGPTVGDRSFTVAESAVRYRERHYEVLVRSTEPMTVQLRQRDVRPLWRRSLSDPEEAWKMWLSHGGSLDVHLLKEFAYTVSPTLIQCALLRKQAALIHAGAIAFEGRAVLLPAWGGTGKSTVVSRSLLDGRGQFLSDDHAVIDAAGRIHLHLLPIHVYAYHAQQDPRIADRVRATCTAGNRLAWHVGARLRPSNLVRWIAPQSLFGLDRLAHAAEVDQVIVMFRGDVDQFRWEPITPAEAARPCAAVIAEEINHLNERLALASAGWADPFLPNPAQAYEGALNVYTAAFGRAQCARLMIPRKAHGQDLVEFLRPRSPIIEQALEPSR